jgi:hypothetical protein
MSSEEFILIFCTGGGGKSQGGVDLGWDDDEIWIDGEVWDDDE